MLDKNYFPFPYKELNLLHKLKQENRLIPEEIEILSNLICRYLDLRAELFHEI